MSEKDSNDSEKSSTKKRTQNSSQARAAFEASAPNVPF